MVERQAHGSRQGRAGGQAGLLAAPPCCFSASFKGNLPTPLWGSWSDLSAATAKGTEDFYQRPQQPTHCQWVRTTTTKPRTVGLWIQVLFFLTGLTDP